VELFREDFTIKQVGNGQLLMQLLKNVDRAMGQELFGVNKIYLLI
jgi:hypothetical protein